MLLYIHIQNIKEKIMIAVYLLLGYVGLDVLGFNLLCFIPLGIAFFSTVMQDKPLPKSAHQYFVVALLLVFIFEIITLSWLSAIMIGGFGLMYLSNQFSQLSALRQLRKKSVNVGDSIKKTVFNMKFNENKNKNNND